MSDIDELIYLIDEMADDISRQAREAKEKALIEKLPAKLKENGVNLCITECRCEGNSVEELRFVFGIDRLDFSEHDKVFEDKIARLEEELKEWRAEAREIKKNRDEQLKSFRKAVEPYVDILHMHETIAELKQHIDELKSKNESLNQSINEITTSRSEWIDKAAEWQQKCEKLENKETEKPTKCTTVIVAKEINGQAYVTLDDFMSVVNDLQAEIGT